MLELQPRLLLVLLPDPVHVCSQFALKIVLFMAFETEPEQKIPRATRIRYQSPTFWFASLRRVLLFDGRCTLLDELYEFSILFFR